MPYRDYSQISISLPILIRLFKNVVVKDMGHKTPCWVRHTNPAIYTRIQITRHNYLAHRVAYALFVGEPDRTLQCDHLCRIPACCNPVHLEMVTPRQNSLRGIGVSAVGANKTHCHRGHEFSPENTRVYIGNNKYHRVCKQCAADNERRWKGRKQGRPVRRYNTNYCLSGHERNETNTRIRPDGHRECKICQKTAADAWRLRKKITRE